MPLGPQPIEHTRTFDMDGAAANFPDINFVILHVGLPWLDEVLCQIVRYPRQPRVFAEIEERGYPPLTEQAKRKFLGENLARLHGGIDVKAKKAELGVPGWT